jgi:hypothetical protein
MGAARCILCEWAGIDSPATHDAPGLYCAEHWSTFRARAKAEQEREPAVVVIGGRMTDAELIRRHIMQQARAG